jgi:hypothetical protein
MPILEFKARPSAIRKVLLAVRDALFRRERTSTGQTAFVREKPGGEGNLTCKPDNPKKIRERLAERTARLNDLDAERERCGDPGFGKTIEHRVIWGELLELELQEIDEQVSRIRGAAGRTTDRRPRSSNRLQRGGPHERKQ